MVHMARKLHLFNIVIPLGLHIVQGEEVPFQLPQHQKGNKTHQNIPKPALFLQASRLFKSNQVKISLLSPLIIGSKLTFAGYCGR